MVNHISDLRRKRNSQVGTSGAVVVETPSETRLMSRTATFVEDVVNALNHYGAKLEFDDLGAVTAISWR